MKTISLIGSGGHCRSVIALLSHHSYLIDGIYDSNFKSAEMILEIPLRGDLSALPANQGIVLAIGDSEARRQLFEKYYSFIIKEPIIHPTVHIEKYVTIGESNNIFAKVFINNSVEIGNNNLINSGAILEHEVKIGSHNHISISATLLGRSQIGDNCFIAAGSIIKEKVKICSNVIVGANSFVAQDITEPGTYVGSPARKVQ